jgi:hypothetical protein
LKSSHRISSEFDIIQIDLNPWRIIVEKLEWELLIEVFGRMQAELIEGMLKANELFQEAVGHFAYPTTFDGLARVQIFVPKNKISEAKELLEFFENGTGEN